MAGPQDAVCTELVSTDCLKPNKKCRHSPGQIHDTSQRGTFCILSPPEHRSCKRNQQATQAPGSCCWHDVKHRVWSQGYKKEPQFKRCGMRREVTGIVNPKPDMDIKSKVLRRAIHIAPTEAIAGRPATAGKIYERPTGTCLPAHDLYEPPPPHHRPSSVDDETRGYFCLTCIKPYYLKTILNQSGRPVNCHWRC